MMITLTIRKFRASVLMFLIGISVLHGLHAQSLKGIIANYAKQSLYLYQCYGDTLLLTDSTHTDKNGGFILDLQSRYIGVAGLGGGMYKIVLPQNQFFYILNDGKPTAIQTVFHPDIFNNWATDSLEVLQSKENKQFYRFQKTQKKVVVANFVLREMLRMFPYYDNYRNEMEKEYNQRYEAMGKLLQQANKKEPDYLATKILRAYYTPNPAWDQPDNWRDSIIAAHYFDYFNPSDSFYLHTNILPEKMEIYLKLKTNKRDNYGQPIRDEMFVTTAVQEFLNKVKSNKANFDFCLNYLLKRLDKEKQFTAMLETYDNYVKTGTSDCESTNKQLDWIRKKVSVLRNIQMGSIAPNFDIEKGSRSLHQLQSDYTLLFFWASWCGHCTQTLPKIKKITDEFNSEKSGLRSTQLITVAISLDYDNKEWQKYIQDNNLTTWLNTSELKGWNGTVPKQYNVYATPTMFLLDKDKKIIAKPEDIKQLTEVLRN